VLLALFLVACIDYGVTRKQELQTWTQPAHEGGVDILWVVDDSLSMDEEQAQLALHATTFVGFLSAAPVDFSLAVTTTDVDGSTAGALTGEALRYVAGSAVVVLRHGSQPAAAELASRLAIERWRDAWETASTTWGLAEAWQGLNVEEAATALAASTPDPLTVLEAGDLAGLSAALEAGASAVLVNSAIALAQDPVRMAEAFKLGVEAGRQAYLAGRIPRKALAQASSPAEGVARPA